MMNRRNGFAVVLVLAVLSVKAQSSQVPAAGAAKVISADDCTRDRLGTTVPASAIGEPVAGVSLAPPKWVSAGTDLAYCSIDGAMAPMDKSSHGRAINFRVVLPASWTGRAA